MLVKYWSTWYHIPKVDTLGANGTLGSMPGGECGWLDIKYSINFSRNILHDGTGLL
jgi:hypothetical protein